MFALLSLIATGYGIFGLVTGMSAIKITFAFIFGLYFGVAHLEARLNELIKKLEKSTFIS